ncbi:caspase family protein [Rivularia sp. UHCC 0363]|uniref:caspase family protein n=1 Tax=Rivularia sp. UHCC 0363 TaxID=3110244 RepID=UPI002B1FE1AA|nr:caspase family protein [Rivularia sp. UHCC 0363]MEA5596701.1 caspase family protein [Rivularia sp. UHCC 0363]
MSRDALVVGINKYPFLKNSSGSHKHLTTPASDAEAIAQLLEAQNNFRVKRFPAKVIDNKLQVDPNIPFKTEELEKAILDLFLPETGKPPETALLFFAGHGLRKQLRANFTQGFLAASDVNPGKIWGFSLRDLWDILQQSQVKQQIIWLDCCFSGELLNFKDTELGTQSSGCDRFLMAASRDYEVAYQQLDGKHGVLTGAILAGLNPHQVPEDDWITNRTLAVSVEQKLQKYYDLVKIPQSPLINNHGEAIKLIQGRVKVTSESFEEDAINLQFRQLFQEILHAEARLRNCHLQKHPECNCQLLAQRRLLKDPPNTLTNIAQDLNLTSAQVARHWSKCKNILQEIVKNIGYLPE